VINAGVSSAIQDNDFKDGFVGSVVGDLAALGADKIGDIWGSGPNKNPFLHVTAHTALGATAAKLTGNDATAGAIGGLVEGVFGNLLGKSFPNTKWGEALYIGSNMLLAGAISDILGHDPMTSAYAAQNAAVNNFWLHKDEYDPLPAAIAECKGGNKAACDRKAELLAEAGKLMTERISDMKEACGGATPQRCAALWQEVGQSSHVDWGKHHDLEGYTRENAPDGFGSGDHIEVGRSPFSPPPDNQAVEPNGNSITSVFDSVSFNDPAHSETPYVESRYADYFSTTSNQNQPYVLSIDLGPVGVFVLNTALDFTPLGTVNDWIAAENWYDYAWVVVAITPFGKALGKLGDAATLFKKGDNAVEGAGGIKLLTGPTTQTARRGTGVANKAGPATDKAGNEIGRFIADSKGNTMIEPVGGRTVVAGKGGIDTHTLYPNGSNYQRLNPQGHANNPTPHGHGHAPGTGPGIKGQGSSLDVSGQAVPFNSPAAHWPIK
jgi:hypothetical protein